MATLAADSSQSGLRFEAEIRAIAKPLDVLAETPAKDKPTYANNPPQQKIKIKIRRPSAYRPSLLQRGPAWDATGSDWHP